MSFGFNKAPGTFQRVMDVVLSTVQWQFALVYLDDVMILSKSLKVYIKHVRHLFAILCNASVTFKLKQCKQFPNSMKYLGHFIHPGLLQISQRTIDSIPDLKPPTNIMYLRSFLGLCNAFPPFVPSFARIMSLLITKFREDQPKGFERLTEDDLPALLILQQKLDTWPVLSLPLPTDTYTMETNSCDLQIDCIFLQQQTTGPGKPTGYWLKSLNHDKHLS